MQTLFAASVWVTMHMAAWSMPAAVTELLQHTHQGALVLTNTTMYVLQNVFTKM